MTIKDFKKVFTGRYDIVLISDEYPELLYSSDRRWLSKYASDEFFEHAEIFNLYIEADPPVYAPVAVIQIETY